MSLTRKQMAEIVAFDWKRRTGGEFDGRRYGDVTGAKAPYFTADWTPCRGIDPRDARHGVERRKPTRKTLRYNYIVPDRVRNSKRTTASGKPVRPDVTVVHVAVRLNGAYQPVVKDVGRWHIKTGMLELRDIDYHGLGGWIVEWQTEDWAGGGKRKKSGRKKRSETGPLIGKPVDIGWCDGGKWKFNTGLTFPWHETVNLNALKGTRYEWCQYGDDTPCKAGLVDWLMMYRQEPKIELLAKMGLHNLICPSGIKALKDRRIRDWIVEHREEAAKRNRDGSPRYEMLDFLYAARHGVTIRDAKKRRLFVSDIRSRIHGAWMRECDFRKMARFDYDRLMKTLPKWGVSAAEYVRYLEYAHETGLDLRNEGTKYPPTRGGRKAFMERLEMLEAEVARNRRREERRRREEERRRREEERRFRAEQKALAAERRAREEAEKKWIAETMKMRIAELEAFQKSLKRTDILKGCGYTLVLAKSQNELLAEGRRMGNCVGCGTYGRAIVKGDSLIVMLKRPSGKGYESFCDIEIDRKKWMVRQCYLKHNKVAPKEVRVLANRLAAWFKAEHIRHRKRRMFKELERKAA